MNLDELIIKLQIIQAQHGGDLPVTYWNDGEEVLVTDLDFDDVVRLY